MKHVQARLSFRKELQSSFHHCGGPVCVRERPEKVVLTGVKVL